MNKPRKPTWLLALSIIAIFLALPQLLGQTVPLRDDVSLATNTYVTNPRDHPIDCQDLANYLDCTTSKSADIVFVFDTTGSMDEEISDMKEISKEFADNLATNGIDAKLGLTEFRDFQVTCGEDYCGSDGDFPYLIYNSGHLTGDSIEFKSWIDNLYANGGGDEPEAILAALKHTATDQVWRGEDVNKIVILITDSDPHPNGDCCNQEGDTFEEVVSDLTNGGIKVFVVGPDTEPMTSLAYDTGGKFYEIRSGITLRNILNEISEKIKCNFNIKVEITGDGNRLKVRATLTGKNDIILPPISGQTDVWMWVTCSNGEDRRFDLEYNDSSAEYCADIEQDCIDEGKLDAAFYAKLCEWSAVKLFNGIEVEFAPVDVGDMIWADKNRNGLQDIGEMGLAGVTVALLDSKKKSTGLTTATDSNGNYHFNKIKPGNYYIQVSAPGGYIFSPREKGADREKDSNSDSDGMTGPVILKEKSDNSIDVGLILTSCIGDLVWVDKNGNGIEDTDENGRAGVTIALLDSNKNSTGLTTTTDFNGNYHFNGLEPGDYYVQFTAPGGYIISSKKHDTYIEKDSNLSSDSIEGPVTLTDRCDNSIDAGLIPNDCIRGRVWVDTNKNGLKDADENGKIDVMAAILDSDMNPTELTTATDLNGNYHFNNLEPGTYYVQFKAPYGYILSQQMLSNYAEGDFYPGSYGVTGPVVLTDGCDNSVDMAILPLCMNGIYVEENSGNDLINYSAMIQLSAANFPAVSEKEVAHIFFSDSAERSLPYWIEEWNVGEKIAKIWVKVPFIPAKNETEIVFQYYTEDSRNSATKDLQGSGSSVFEFFDDFMGSALNTNKWTTQKESNGSITKLDGFLQVHADARSLSSADLILKENFGPGNAMRFRANISEGQSYDRKGLGFMNTNVGKDTNRVGASVYWRGQDTDLFAHHIFPISEKNILDVKIQRAKSNYEGSFNTWEVKWLDSEIRFGLNSQEFRQDTRGKPLNGISPRFSLNTTLTSLSSDIFVDWVFVRKCIAKEPTTRFGQRICMN